VAETTRQQSSAYFTYMLPGIVVLRSIAFDLYEVMAFKIKLGVSHTGTSVSGDWVQLCRGAGGMY